MGIRIVFMGTPDFAVPCLDALISSEHEVVGVFSQPDRPQGRGYKLTPPEVKILATEHDIPVFQPTKLRDGEVQKILTSLNPDLIVVVAYGRVLPKEILELPRLGCINVHGSLLPRWRGAAPIQWSILSGDKVTGVTTMHMAEGLDTGDIILAQETEIEADETSGQLFDRLSLMGAELLMKTISLLIAGSAPRTPQEESKATYASMIDKKMGELDFGKTAKEVVDWVRGMSPWPVAFTHWNNNRVAVHQAEIVQDYHGFPGEILDEKELIVACGEKAVRLLRVQLQGKKAVSGKDFANGYRVKKGEKFA